MRFFIKSLSVRDHPDKKQNYGANQNEKQNALSHTGGAYRGKTERLHADLYLQCVKHMHYGKQKPQWHYIEQVLSEL